MSLYERPQMGFVKEEPATGAKDASLFASYVSASASRSRRDEHRAVYQIGSSFVVNNSFPFSKSLTGGTTPGKARLNRSTYVYASIYVYAAAGKSMEKRSGPGEEEANRRLAS
ncbi:hypothetical protein D9619_011553 [Psilocybe cf. subviscida]|uniref:Uncharacterized protein n=1 Tax=Psilocybe cf. subviscida TaxID=2480587 RepID=A0A8H5BSW7_9AGAR|nr:hypothetical protein D9619_011553 [Psilocybe cf. subviscida]